MRYESSQVQSIEVAAMRSKRIVVLVLAAASMTGCSLIFDPGVCTANVAPGVNVLVQDSASGARVASGAQLIARDGAYADSSSYPANHPELDSSPLQGAFERGGTYSVTVRRAGYRDWTRNNVSVTKGACHVNTVTLTALLQQVIAPADLGNSHAHGSLRAHLPAGATNRVE